MKKRILFVIPSLRSGGAEKSLVTLLSLFDYEKYEVDLLLFRRDGLFLEKIPKEINYIYDTSDYEIFDGSAKFAVNYFLKKFDFSAAADRIKYMKIFSETDLCTQELKAWQFLKKRLPKISREYDCAIAYLEGNSSDFVTSISTAKKKICYVHNDIRKLPHLNEVYSGILGRADKIVTVSQLCLDSLLAEFPEFSDKYSVIENIISRQIIQADSVGDTEIKRIDGETVLLTVGRCYQQKNIKLAVDTCAELKKRGRKIKWYHIGKGEMYEELCAYVRQLGMENDFIMLGERANPYPYMAQCDIYVQPSRFEGKSIAIDEVKCLNKPIVVTDFPSVYDQITDGVNGIICRMNEIDMADRIELLTDNAELRTVLSQNLSKEKIGNEDEINKLYALIES